MKKLILVCALLMLVSCQMNESTDNAQVQNYLTYFKDPRTGLCFASINSSTYGGNRVTSITCVPCDSLKKIGIR